MTAAGNPYFARATANWVWAQLFGKGLVDPPDDLSRSNPPVHPELLDALARHFVASKYDLRDLIRTIAIVAGLRALVRDDSRNERDSRLFSHQMPPTADGPPDGRCSAQATDVPNTFGTLGPGWPSGSPTRAWPARSSIRSAGARAPRAVPGPDAAAEPQAGPALDRRRHHRNQGHAPERLPRPAP